MGRAIRCKSAVARASRLCGLSTAIPHAAYAPIALRKLVSRNGCLFILILFVTACSNTKKDLSIFDQKKLNQEDIINVVSYLSQGGLNKARLTAPLMVRYTSDSVRVEFTRGLHTEFFLDSATQPTFIDTNVVESHITAKYGRYTEFNNLVYLKDSVVCYNTIKQDTLWCDELWWNQNEQRIYTTGNFRFKTFRGDNMYGRGPTSGFSAKQDLSEYTLYNSKGVIASPNGVLPN